MRPVWQLGSGTEWEFKPPRPVRLQEEEEKRAGITWRRGARTKVGDEEQGGEGWGPPPHYGQSPPPPSPGPPFLSFLSFPANGPVLTDGVLKGQGWGYIAGRAWGAGGGCRPLPILLPPNPGPSPPSPQQGRAGVAQPQPAGL